MAFGPKPRSVAERFWPKVDKSAGPDGCWVWTAGTDSRGYGRLNIDRTPELAHRISYRLTNGAIPDGIVICHHCDNPPCCNPAHLFAGTRTDNNRDMVAKGRHWRQQRTHCKRGHEFDATYMHRGRPTRFCRTCHRMHSKATKARKRAARQAAAA